MENRYKKEMSKYKINDSVKKRVDAHLVGNKKRKMQVVYGGMLVLFISLVSVGVVYAEEIKTFIESWGKAIITFYKEDGTTEKIELNEIKTVKTKLDEFVFEDAVYASLDIHDGFYPAPVEGVTSFKGLKIKEVQDKIGVFVLGFENIEYKYTYTEVTSDKKIGGIRIEMTQDYVVDCGVAKKCNPLGKKYKGLSIDAVIRTKNAEEKDYNLTEWGYAYSHDGREHPSIKRFSKIGNMDVEGISYVESVLDHDGKYEEFVTDMLFNYENVRYHVSGWNLTHEEILAILKENLR